MNVCFMKTLQVGAYVILYINVRHKICICSSGDRAAVSGAACRGFDSLQMCSHEVKSLTVLRGEIAKMLRATLT